MIEALLWALPAFITNPAAVLSSLLPKRHPLDFYLTCPDGRRVFGDGKTVEGTFLALVFGYATYLLVAPFSSPLVPIGAVIGDLAGSFVKRRFGLERGESATLLDQLDFLLGALALSPIDPASAAFLIVLTPILHRAFNIIGFYLGLKKEPW